MRHSNTLELNLGYGAGDGGNIHAANGHGDRQDIIRGQAYGTALDGDGFSVTAVDCSECLLTGERISNHAV